MQFINLFCSFFPLSFLFLYCIDIYQTIFSNSSDMTDDCGGFSRLALHWHWPCGVHGSQLQRQISSSIIPLPALRSSTHRSRIQMFYTCSVGILLQCNADLALTSVFAKENVPKCFTNANGKFCPQILTHLMILEVETA